MQWKFDSGFFQMFILTIYDLSQNIYLMSKNKNEPRDRFDIASVGSFHFYMFFSKRDLNPSYLKLNQLRWNVRKPEVVKAAWKSWSAESVREVTIEAVWELSLLQRLRSVTCFMFVPDTSMSQSELPTAHFKGIVNLYQLLWAFSQLFWFLQSNVKRVSCDLSERYFGIIDFHVANRNSHSAEWQRGKLSSQPHYITLLCLYI